MVINVAESFLARVDCKGFESDEKPGVILESEAVANEQQAHSSTISSERTAL